MSQQTKQKEIWKYLNSADLIKVEDISDKTKIKNLELAANGIIRKKQYSISIVVPFNLNNLINAKSIYQTLVKSKQELLFIRSTYWRR